MSMRNNKNEFLVEVVQLTHCGLFIYVCELGIDIFFIKFIFYKIKNSKLKIFLEPLNLERYNLQNKNQTTTIFY